MKKIMLCLVVCVVSAGAQCGTPPGGLPVPLQSTIPAGAYNGIYNGRLRITENAVEVLENCASGETSTVISANGLPADNGTEDVVGKKETVILGQGLEFEATVKTVVAAQNFVQITYDIAFKIDGEAFPGTARSTYQYGADGVLKLDFKLNSGKTSGGVVGLISYDVDSLQIMGDFDRLAVNDHLRALCIATDLYDNNEAVEQLLGAAEESRIQGFCKFQLDTETLTICDDGAGGVDDECLECFGAIVDQVYGESFQEN